MRGKSGGAAAERSKIREKPSLKRPPPRDTHTEQLCVINKHLICPQAEGSNIKKRETHIRTQKVKFCLWFCNHKLSREYYLSELTGD